MIVVCGIILIFLALLFVSKTRYKLSPQSVYLLWWGGMCCMSALRLRGEATPSVLTCVIIMLGALFFLIGYHMGICTKIVIASRRTMVSRGMIFKEQSQLRDGAIYVVGFFACVFLGILGIRSLRFYQMGVSIGIIRQYYWSIGSGIINNAFEYFIAHTIVDTIILLYDCIFAIQFAQRKLKKPFVLLMALMTLLNMFINGGRMNLVEIILLTWLAMVISGRKMMITAKLKRRLILITSILFFCVVVLTISRQGTQNIFITMWSQYTMNIPFMSYLIEYQLVSNDITYGYNFFRGFFELFFMVLGEFGIPIPDVQYVIGRYTNPFFVMDGGVKTNAYVSHLFYFYVDGRLPGVVLFSFLFGWLSAAMQKKYMICPSNANLGRMLIIYNVIYNTFYQWKFANISYFLTFFVIGWFYKKELSKHEEVLYAK